jgi:PhzF family phenazine biosynthesis protein
MIELYLADAFAEAPLTGNPAAVVLLERWPSDTWMQQVATEINYSDTAFVVPLQHSQQLPQYEIRWFTPSAEVPLCGHATLVTAWVLFDQKRVDAPKIQFVSKSGQLQVLRRNDGRFELDFPARPLSSTAIDPSGALGRTPSKVMRSPINLVAVFEREADVRAMSPDFAAIRTLDCLGVIVTAPGDQVDFVSRCFGPAIGIDEDPVTGSAHCDIAPYWAARLGRTELRAQQLSRRGGHLLCRVEGDRVKIAGFVAPFAAGTLLGPPAQ